MCSVNMASRTDAHDITLAAARLARAAADGRSTAARPRFAIGAMGPGTRTISVTANVTFDEVLEGYYVQARALIEGGVDALLLETCQDTLNVKAAAIGLRRAMDEAGVELPLMVSGTIEPMGTMLAGQAVDALYASLEHLDLFSIGLNCATGPEFMTDHLRTLSEIATCFVTVYPNAGLPDEHGHYEETAESLALKMRRFVDEGWVNLIGGCCGTTAAHTRALARLAEGQAAAPPRRVPPARGERDRGVLSDRRQSPRDRGRAHERHRLAPVQGADRRGEVRGGLGDRARPGQGGRPGRRRLPRQPGPRRGGGHGALHGLHHPKVKVPLMIDSTDAAVIELALRKCQGKAIVNSINLEDGEERFERVVPLLKTYGGAVVVGCIDEDKQQGMAVTRARKLAIAERSYALLTEKYGLRRARPHLRRPRLSRGDGRPELRGLGGRDHRGHPGHQGALPGVPDHPRHLERVVRAAPGGARGAQRRLPLPLHQGGPRLRHRQQRAARALRVHPRGGARARRGPDLDARRRSGRRLRRALPREEEGAAEAAAAALPLDERLARYIVEGSKEGLIDDLGLKLEEAGALQIINGPLMRGMEEVGRLFNDNQLIVAEVLQSAEAMKAAVAHLEGFMAKDESSTRGTMVLATVKGDVHDIGKNLVEIILKNNGYRIINLGIKVPPEDLIAAYHPHKPDAFGLSGLLVKSAQQMVVTAQDLRAAGIEIPLFVGGAALTRKFTATRIAAEYPGPTLYAKDAMDGLDLANRLFSATTRDALLEQVRGEQEALRGGADGGQVQAPAPVGGGRRAVVGLARRRPCPRRPTSTCTCCAMCR